MSTTILVVDDEKNIRRSLRMVLDGEGFDVLTAESAEEGLEVAREELPDLVLMDIRLPQMSGIEAMEVLLKERPGLPIIVISGHASVSEAVAAVQKGAVDFFEKPLDRERVLISVRNALKRGALEQELAHLREESDRRYEMIGDSPVMKDLFSKIEKVAPTSGRVLITGESGTGKELIARAIHKLSLRNQKPFIKVNCAAIPAELIESELFGHERGSFTGAHAQRKGFFEQADGGTLFLDEIGDMSLSAQAKVLRALQNGEVSRVGSGKVISVDVRVLAATNKDLEQEVQNGTFREDLFFRLNVVPIQSPRLEARREDIPQLVRSFLEEIGRDFGGTKAIDADALDGLTRRAWPGNVRELRNVVERMNILSGPRITLSDLPDAPTQKAHPGGPDLPATLIDGRPMTLREYRESAERAYILASLEEHGWVIARAAEKLGLERTNLHKKLKSHGIERPE